MYDSVLTKRQVKTFSKVIQFEGYRCKITAKVRYDDSCGNGHNSFAITGSIDRVTQDGRMMRNGDIMGGCIHEEIEKHFPELRHLIKWHLCSSDGPMHYIANTMYHASARDHWGKLKGEVRSTETQIKFDTNPITHAFPFKPSFVAMLENFHKAGHLDRLEIERVEHGPSSGSYDFDPKYTFTDAEKKGWSDCPFDKFYEAENFLHALQHCEPQFVTMPTAWGEGKEPNLEYARNSACAPNASLEQLSNKEWLEARLSGLVLGMQHDLVAFGLVW